MKQTKITTQPSPKEPQTAKDPLNNGNSCHRAAMKSTAYLCLALQHCSIQLF